MRRVLEISEACYGTNHPDVAKGLNNLALLLQATNRLAEAEPLMRRMAIIFLCFTRDTGHPHPHLKAALRNYAGLVHAWQGPEEMRARVQSLGSEAGLTPEQFLPLLAAAFSK